MPGRFGKLHLQAWGPQALSVAVGLTVWEIAGRLTPAAILAPPSRVFARMAAMLASGVRLVAIRCRCVYPGRFNERLARGLNKSDILSETTLAVASTLAKTTEQPSLIWCDRHGGRKKYAGVVTEAFDGAVVQPLEETAVRSVYRIVPAGSAADAWRRIEFTVGGESRTPVAIASMTAKYVRERAMECFNRYWSSRQPGLRPTAGYPLDANRWRSDAAAAIAAAGIDASILWRRV